jgi:hypothetical protein
MWFIWPQPIEKDDLTNHRGMVGAQSTYWLLTTIHTDPPFNILGPDACVYLVSRFVTCTSATVALLRTLCQVKEL